MTGKELVRTAADFENPPTIPRSSPKRESDTFRIDVGAASDFTPTVPGADQWGCVKEKNLGIAGVAGYPTVHPLADWDRYEDYVFPDPAAKGRFDHIDRMADGNDPRLTQQFVYAGIGVGSVTLCSFLLGFQNFLLTLALHPDRIRELVARYHAYQEAIVERMAAYDFVDAILYVDDSAMQTGPFFSMDTWRELFKPSLRELCALTHAHGKKFLMHCCGNLTEHLAEFHECGVDILDNKQPLLWLDAAREFRGRMTFHACIDYPVFERMPEKDVAGKIDELIRAMSVPQGGFIGTINNMIDPKVPERKLQAVWKAYRAFSWAESPVEMKPSDD